MHSGHTGREEPLTFIRAQAVQPLTRSWWLMLLRGVASILFGIAAFVWPGLTVLVLTVLYGAFAMADGVLALGAAVTGTAADTRGRSVPTWWLVLVGLVGVAAGAVAFLWPGLTAFALVVIIGAWAVAIGVFEIVGAIRLREELEDEWLLIAAGILAVLFGLALLLQPGAGALALVWGIGTFAVLSGLLHVAFAFRLKAAQRRVQAGGQGQP